MRRISVLMLAFGFLFVAWSGATAAETKWVRGNVTAVSANSVTVKAQDKDMTFKVDSSTDVVASGGATATREAQRAGKAGIELSQIVHVGDRIEVHYAESDMKAVEIRRLSGGTHMGASGGEKPATGGEKPATGAQEAEEHEGRSTRGMVTKVGADMFTVKFESGEQTFYVDAKTRFIGSGLSTKTRELQAKGQSMKVSDAIRMNEQVVVNYHDVGGKLHATDVRVIR